MASRLAELLDREHTAMADFLVALADFDRTREWMDLGYASVFDFLHRRLGLSKGASQYRKAAARLLQKFPEIEQPLRDGRLCLSTIISLGKVITVENREEVLPKFFHSSKREAMVVAAALQPTAAPYRDVITRVTRGTGAIQVEATSPTQAATGNGVVAANGAAAEGEILVQPVEPAGPPSPSTGAHGIAPVPGSPAASIKRDSEEPLTAELSRIHVTVSRRFLAKLEAARMALSHSHPGAGNEAILEAGLDLVLRRHAQRRGLVEKPRKDSDAVDSSGIPASVKRAVWRRDKGCCQWPLAGGGICSSRLRIQFDHKVTRALGGKSTVRNLRLLCAFHNDQAARRAFGDEWMDQFKGGPGVKKRPGQGPPRA